MRLTGDRREVLKVLASREKVPLYLLMRLNQANITARISELRVHMDWKIPPPVLKKNRQGRIMSTYSMPADERARAQRVLANRGKA